MSWRSGRVSVCFAAAAAAAAASAVAAAAIVVAVTSAGCRQVRAAYLFSSMRAGYALTGRLVCGRGDGKPALAPA